MAPLFEKLIFIVSDLGEFFSMENNRLACNVVLAIAAVTTTAGIHLVAVRSEHESAFRRRAFRAEITATIMIVAAVLLVFLEFLSRNLVGRMCFGKCPDTSLLTIFRSWLPWIANWTLGAAAFAFARTPWLR